MSLIGYALRTAKQYYKPDTRNHVLRVAGYVSENPMIPWEKMDDCIALAIMHDLKEDTEWDDEYIPGYEHLWDCLNLLTKPNDMDYRDYLNLIHNCSYGKPEAYWVKLADIKDHLMQTETLTDKLRDKYINALPYLL